jgi:signal transduction histidine kinase
MIKEPRQSMPYEDRLILDVHDSAQQQIFALSMQVGALKILLKRDQDAALKSLQTIENLVCLVQQDLTSIGYALRSDMRKSPG